MTTPAPQAGLTPEEVTALYEKLDALPKLPRQQQPQALEEINELAMKLSPEQAQALQQRQLEKLTPEQKAQLQQQQARMMQLSPLEALQSRLLQAFNAVNQEVAGPGASLADRIAFLNAGAEVAKGIAALQTALLEEDKFAAAQQQMPKPSTGKLPGQYL